jgi:hypothetical protein
MVLTGTSLARAPEAALAARTLSRSPSALLLTSGDHDGRTHFELFTWRAFTRPTVAEDRER